MRTTYVAGNWKMNMDREGTVALVKELVAQLKDCKNKVMIAPPFVYLDLVSQLVKGTNILLGAQNCAATDNGAHTGEISVAMLAKIPTREFRLSSGPLFFFLCAEKPWQGAHPMTTDGRDRSYFIFFRNSSRSPSSSYNLTMSCWYP